MAPSHGSGRLVGAKRAAYETGIAYRTLLDLLHRGELPVIRIGRAIYVDRRDIDRWIESQKALNARTA
jgi:excisionase family DNA binding protein